MVHSRSRLVLVRTSSFSSRSRKNHFPKSRLGLESRPEMCKISFSVSVSKMLVSGKPASNIWNVNSIWFPHKFEIWRPNCTPKGLLPSLGNKMGWHLEYETFWPRFYTFGQCLCIYSHVHTCAPLPSFHRFLGNCIRFLGNPMAMS